MAKIVLVFLVFLMGCSVDAQQVSENLQLKVDEALQAETPSVLNVNTPYYSYYLPPHMGIRFSNKIATVFVSNQHEIVLRVDVPTIIMQRYYRSALENNMQTLNFTDEFFTYITTFTNQNKELQNLDISITQQQENYVIYLQSNQFVLTSTVKLADVQPVLYDMLVILRSAKADKNEIVSIYSNKQVIDYRQQVLEIFEQVAPSTGTLADMNRLVTEGGSFIDFLDPEFDEPLQEQPPVIEEENEEEDE